MKGGGKRSLTEGVIKKSLEIYISLRLSVYSMMNNKHKGLSVVTLKKLCDGVEITLGEFFSTKEFDKLEQEIK